jgi:hypothetical protein
MFRQTVKLFGMALLLVAITLFNVATGHAAEIERAGTGEGNAMAPTVGWVSIEPGQAHWYTFNYDYDDDDGVKHVVATLQMASPNSVSFEVQTHERLGPYIDIDFEDIPGPLGVGSPLFRGTDDDGDTLYNAHTLVWQGGSKEAGDYLIIVEGDGEYVLSVEGETVNFKAEPLNQAAAFAAGAAPAVQSESSDLAVGAGEIQTESFALNIESTARSLARTAGTGPENAMAPSADWVSIEPGQTHWYTFNYDYDSDDGVKKVVAMLQMASPNSVGFEVQTHERLGPYMDIEDDPGALGVGSPLFRGTDDDGDNIYNAHAVVWEGGSKEAGDYLIIVEGDVEYLLSVEGETVNFK